ncbi:MAG: peptidylprolyl isomerase [Bacteroidaceae bacterium]|nr:peptidylprolyl isomerase [Bacteroidaceae bacterium]
MKKIVLAAASLLMGVSAFAQADDPVIMKLNGKNVTRSEFEYSFNKNNSDGVLDKKTVEEYVPLFVDFKLKVAEAESQRIDTIAAIRKELDGYKEQMVIPTLVDSAFIEREARKTYDNTAARFEGQDLLTASHILVLLRQDATSEQEAAGKARIDSIYDVLKAVPKEQLAEKFAELAKETSDDKGSAQRGGALGQFGKGMMIPDFENAAYALQAGEMSAPIKSTVGYHIIYMTDRHPFEPYEFHHDNIIKFLEQRGIKEASANAYVDSIATLQGKTRAEVIDELHQQILANDAEQKYLSQEYYDGTLMYEVTKKDVWDKAQQDVAGQEAYFNAHKKDYAWDAPRFCGIVLHAKDAATIAKAKKLLKGVAEDDYAKTVTSALNNDSVKLVRVEKGIFKQGDNANVDKLVFKQKTELKPMKDFPATDVFGKTAKAPRSVKDVRGQVTTDYQNMMEKQWVDELRKKFSVEVYEDVVKTVNKH